MAPSYREAGAAFEGTGLSPRGGFVPTTDDDLAGAKAVVLFGNVGPDFWRAFEAGRRDEPEPMDAWTKRVVSPIAARLGARAFFPSDQPYKPFQRWAMRADAVAPSPLGVLIHPVYGLWHAYRAALAFDVRIDDLPDRSPQARPCDACVAKPCLSACPVGAFNGSAYDVAACAGHLRSGGPPDCGRLGCRARDACPVGGAFRYPQAQVDFHMAAFVRSRAVAA